MNYWWVNHGTSYRVEVENGYIWSPQSNKVNIIPQGYKNLTLTIPNDIIFSYAGGKISAIGKISGLHHSSLQPEKVGNWEGIGWLVPISWIKLPVPLIPKNIIEQIRDYLPEKYSPLKQDGNGREMYLSNIGEALGKILINEIIRLGNNIEHELSEMDWEIDNSIQEQEEQMKVDNELLSVTERKQISLARIGQGKFKRSVETIETGCRLTGVTIKSMLTASHIKSWKDSNNFEKLDGNNGLLLSPHVDRLFDRGLISFTNVGNILLKNNDVKETMIKWGLDPMMNVGSFNNKQKIYLDFHREIKWAGNILDR